MISHAITPAVASMIQAGKARFAPTFGRICHFDSREAVQMVLVKTDFAASLFATRACILLSLPARWKTGERGKFQWSARLLFFGASPPRLSKLKELYLSETTQHMR